MSELLNEQHRLLDLLIAKELNEIGSAQSQELEALLKKHPDFSEDTVAIVSGALDVAMLEHIDEMPSYLETKIIKHGESMVGRKKVPVQVESVPVDTYEPPMLERAASVLTPWKIFAVTGWAVAATILILFLASVPQKKPAQIASNGMAAKPVQTVEDVIEDSLEKSEIGNEEAKMADADVPADPESIREELIRDGALTTYPWSRSEDQLASGVTGDIIWHDKKQAGYMRFYGLQPNNPDEGQYQLWIFDADRPEAYPVDGGVFDITDYEAIVPIHAKLSVNKATLFAVTYEKPGGVVVSDRSRIIVTAKAL